MQGGSNQTLNSPSTRALGKSHWCHTCNSNQGGTIKIKARIEHLCAVLRLNNRLLMDQGRMLPTTEFIHVPSEENPADLCSRGLLATQLEAQQKFRFQNHRSWDHLFRTNRRNPSQKRKPAKNSNP